MKVIVSRIPDELYDTLKEQLAQKGQTMDGYLKGLVFNDINPKRNRPIPTAKKIQEPSVSVFPKMCTKQCKKQR